MDQVLDLFSDSGTIPAVEARHAGSSHPRTDLEGLKKISTTPSSSICAMQVAGLFHRFDLPIATEYKIRRLMVMSAMSTTAMTPLLKKEMQAIQKLEPNVASSST